MFSVLRQDQTTPARDEAMSAHSGDDKYDEIQKRLQAAKYAVVHAESADEATTAQSLVEQIEQEAAAYSSDLHERMRAEFLRAQMSRMFRN